MEKERFATYLQKKNYDCGAGAAGIVLLNFGIPKVNHNRIMSSLEVKRSGTEPENLVKFFKRRGFDVFSTEGATVSDLRREIGWKRLPVILYQGSGTKEEISQLEGGHYSVVAGIGNKYIYLLDPGIGEDFGNGIGWNKLSLSTFDRRWRDKWNENGKEVLVIRWMLSVGLRKRRR